MSGKSAAGEGLKLPRSVRAARIVCRAWRLLLCAVVGAMGAFVSVAIAQGPPAYKPELNQPGKDVVWVPTPDALVERMLDLAQVSAYDSLIDLGSGDGRLVIAAAKRGAQAVGIEYDAKLVAFARQSAQQQGVAHKAGFVKADLFASDFTAATVITLFLGPDLNRKLLPKLLKLKPGTRIVSNTHPIGHWPPDATAASGDDEKSVYYRTAMLWIVPANVAGRWQWAGGELTIRQHYQKVTGMLKSGVVVTAFQLRGDAVQFESGEVRYEGRVAGDAISGTVTTNGAVREWRARLVSQR